MTTHARIGTEACPRSPFRFAKVAIIMPGHLATMVAMVFDTCNSHVTYDNAGHEPPFLQLPSGEIERWMMGDLLLGADDDATYDEESVSVPRGAKIVLVEVLDGDQELTSPRSLQTA